MPASDQASPSLEGRSLEASLTVADARTSAAWYRAMMDTGTAAFERRNQAILAADAKRASILSAMLRRNVQVAAFLQ